MYAQLGTIDQLSWGSPVGIAILLVGIGLLMYLLSLAIKNFDDIDKRKTHR